jgi:hypothetical protein
MPYSMAISDKNETESPAIIEEIIPGKNNDGDNKSPNQKDSNNNQKPIIQKYNEQESAQAVSEATEDYTKTIERNASESTNQIPRFNQSIEYTQKQMSLATKENTENYLEFQKQAINSYQSVYVPYFQNFQNQLQNNQEYFRSITELYYNLFSSYIEGATVFTRIFNEVSSSNMNFLTNIINSSSSSTIDQSRMSSFQVDSGRNSNESSTNVKTTFSCETCGQIFDSRQDLKEHISITHYNIQ